MVSGEVSAGCLGCHNSHDHSDAGWYGKRDCRLMAAAEVCRACHTKAFKKLLCVTHCSVELQSSEKLVCPACGILPVPKVLGVTPVLHGQCHQRRVQGGEFICFTWQVPLHSLQAQLQQVVTSAASVTGCHFCNLATAVYDQSFNDGIHHPLARYCNMWQPTH
jgi:hypothetical protein